MAGTLQHSPADVLRYLLIDHSMGGLPSGVSNADWSIFVDNEPDSPDNCITVYNSVSKQNGRVMVGEVCELHGIQVRVRSQISKTGYNKIREIAVEIDENVIIDTVTIGTATYCVHSFKRTTDIISFGKDTPNQSKRHIHTFNGLLTVRQKVIGTGF